MNLTLYELASEFRHTADLLADMELDEQTVRDTLEAAAFPVEQKCAHVAAFIRNMEATADQIKQAEKQMADRRKAMEGRASSIRKYLLDNMQACGMTKIEHPMFSISVRSNPESVQIEDERLVPQDYLREIPAKYELDKVLIKQALKDGYDVPGARLNRSQRLEIK